MIQMLHRLWEMPEQVKNTVMLFFVVVCAIFTVATGDAIRKKD